MQMIKNKQRLWESTGKVKDYTKYKDALKETTHGIRKSKLNFERKLAANIKQDSKRCHRHGRPTKRQRWYIYNKWQINGRRSK